MDKKTRNDLASVTQRCRFLLEEEFGEQLEGSFDVFPDGRIAEQSGAPLLPAEELIRVKIIGSIQHRSSKGESDAESVRGFLRECAFTFLNRIAALKMMEARGIVQECVSKGDESTGFKEFCGLAPGLVSLPDRGYRLYLECLFDEVGREVGVLFDRVEPNSLLWPRRKALESLLAIINDAKLEGVWAEDETIGWIYQYYNDPAERKKMREESAAPRNSRELAVRNQFFTPRYVVEFLTDNTLGRIWYEMRGGATSLKDKCRYLVGRPDEVFFGHVDYPELTAARAWLEGESEREPDFFALSEVANGYQRLGDPDSATRWMEERLGAHEDNPDLLQQWSTQAILDLMFIMVRNDHFCDGFLDGFQWEMKVFVEELRRRRETNRKKESLSQKELIEQTVYIPHRPLKDPREIRLLDPACGSMHFGLYAFDLFETIYREAWDHHPELLQDLREQSSSPSPPSEGGEGRGEVGDSLAARDRFLRLIPKLIIEHNIHGVDIDPRAVQIAGLSLWLRAQKTWKDTTAAGRPRVRRSNIVCAEPMPGSDAMLEDFVQTLDPPLLGELVKTVFEKMQLAGEAGALLKIEEEIRTAIDAAKAKWEKLGAAERDLFSAEELNQTLRPDAQQDLTGVEKAQTTDHRPLATDFFDTAEERIYAALRDYAESAEAGDYQRRLFAEDAAHGFAFIDLCRKRYEAVVMNPPFGDASLPSKSYIEETYANTKGDVYMSFVECFNARLVPAGYLGIISSRTGFFLGQSEDWRSRVILRQFRPIALADLGSGVLDAMVEVAAYVLRNLSISERNDLTLSLVPNLETVERDTEDRFSFPKWQKIRGGLKRHQAATEIEHLETSGFVQRCDGAQVRYTPVWRNVRAVSVPTEPRYPALVCIRALAEEDKESAIMQAVQGAGPNRTFVCNPREFSRVPGSPFSYWVGPRTLSLFGSFPKLKSAGREAAIGASTKDDFRYLRLVWELPESSVAITREETSQGRPWVRFAKGGSFSHHYFDIYLAVDWGDDGREVKASISEYRGSRGWGYQWTAALNGHSHYFRGGLTWPRRTNGLSFRILPSGCIFADKGPAVFVPSDERDELLATNGLLSSTTFRGLVALQLARVDLAQSYEAGLIQQTPIPGLSSDSKADLSALVHRTWIAKRRLDSATATSHAFLLPGVVASLSTSLRDGATTWTAEVASQQQAIADAQEEIDALASSLYGLRAEDRLALTETLVSHSTPAVASAEGNGDSAIHPLTIDLAGYILGCTLGRWDIRYATGDRQPPELPDPFDPLPVCPPGMLQNADGLPAAQSDVPDDYPLPITWPGILVSDPGHPEDIVARVRDALAVIWGDRSSAIEQEACEILGVKSLRHYFAKPAKFFADHLKRYSKSRRQAPIYWPLSTGADHYTIWLYYHRLTEDTLFTVLRDHVEPRLKDEEQFHTRCVHDASSSPTPDNRRKLAESEDLLAALRSLQTELQRVAPLYKPDLNDGVIINSAPLWRMIPHSKWQKDCKACWDKLVKGEYDWAHLAMHLWPDRVVPKCQKDRSLAIAHGLDEVFWGEDEKGKAKAKKVSQSVVDDLIAERTSPAVKAALDDLLSAPPLVGVAKKKRKKK